MRHGSLLWQLFPPYFLAGTLAVVVCIWFLTDSWVVCVLSLLPLLGTVLIFHNRFIHPLLDIKAGLERFAAGSLDAKIRLDESLELSKLSRAANKMAADLKDKLATIIRQGSEREAVLLSMREAVIVIDTQERILRVNQAAYKLVGIEGADVMGKTVEEVFRHPALQRFLKRAFEAQDAIEEEILVEEKHGVCFFQAYGRKLRDAQMQDIGVLVVMNDVTRLHKLEQMRSEFVANVSHELKTPITSIKGFVETLLEGAIDKPLDARRFLEIILRHADRLNALLEDLLSLSRLEQETERKEIKLQRMKIRGILEAAVQNCAYKAGEKKISVGLDCLPEIEGDVEATLLEQAVVNLIDNAIKYSEPSTSVKVEAAVRGGEVLISVIDQGRGIDKAHLPRIFERFYRVDKARSRQEGGTGLGLAIVKHIAQAHGGYASVESTPGRGSVFFIHLPLNCDSADASSKVEERFFA